MLKRYMQNTAIQFETLNPAIKNYISELETFKHKYYELKERYDAMMYKKYVRSAEELLAGDKQQPLFTEPEEVISEESETEKQEIKSYTRKKPGRKPLDSNLRRVEEIIDIPENEKTCACGTQMTKIGEETSEKLEIIPQSIYVTKTIRPKYACRHCEGTEDEDKPAVRIASVPPSIIPRSIASASLLSYIMIHKYQDHLPFYRQELQFQRIGIEISRQDMSNWQQHVYEKLLPLFNLLEKIIKIGIVMRMDETAVQVMGEEGRSDIQKSCIWLARGGPPDRTVVLYRYRQTHAAYNAKEFLEGFKGYLQTDGNEVYDSAVRELPGIIHVGCFAHARRKFFEASKATKKPQSAEEGLKYIRKLYEIESTLRNKNLEENKFLLERKELAEPILCAFRAWLNKRANEVLPSAQLGKAVAYTLKQWDKLIAYLESPYLTPDNNASENAIRPFVLGRKNWLFNKSPKGADSSCGMYSLIETAKQNGVEPLKYLRELFEKAPYASTPEDWQKLLPWNIFKL
jgi:transposase